MNDSATLSAAQYQQRVANLIERGRFDLARQELTTALGQFPQHSDLLYEAARLDLREDNPQAAYDTLQQLLASDPEHLYGRFLLAVVLEELHQLPRAEEVLLDLLSDYPEQAALYAHYAMLMYRTLHVEKAKALSREAVRLDPDNEQALAACLIGDLIDGRTVAQQGKLHELLRKHPEDMSTSRLLIAHLVDHGKYWSAKRVAVELLRAQPNSPELLKLVVDLEFLAHWSMIPLWPLNRWGIGATISLYVLTLLGMTQLRKHLDADIMGSVNIALLCYVVYSWIYPPILRRWIKRRAGV